MDPMTTLVRKLACEAWLDGPLAFGAWCILSGREKAGTDGETCDPHCDEQPVHVSYANLSQTLNLCSRHDMQIQKVRSAHLSCVSHRSSVPAPPPARLVELSCMVRASDCTSASIPQPKRPSQLQIRGRSTLSPCEHAIGFRLSTASVAVLGHVEGSRQHHLPASFCILYSPALYSPALQTILKADARILHVTHTHAIMAVSRKALVSH